MSTTIDPTTTAGARALERLANETIGWLTTVNPDGAPQSSPVWFVWEDGEVRLYSWIRAPRNDNLARAPAPSRSTSTPRRTAIRTSRWRAPPGVDPGAGPASGDERFMAKYRGRIEGYGWTTDYYDATYPHVIRIAPTRWRVG